MEAKDVEAAATNAAAGLIAGDKHARELEVLTATIRRCDDDKGRPFRIKRDGSIEVVERLLETPTYRRGAVKFYEALTFSRFVKRFKNETTVLFADPIAKSFTAALDYHPSGGAQHGASWDQFRATLPLRHTEAWTAWSEVNKVAMDQATFAQFLEDNIPNIADPDGATLVEIARTLEAKTDVMFESHIRADNGAHRFAYVENVNGTSAGNITIPQQFTLMLQPFEGAQSYEVKARFRYRITSKRLALWFDLIRFEDILREAFDDELLKIQAAVGEETPIFNGPAPVAQTPPAAE